MCTPFIALSIHRLSPHRYTVYRSFDTLLIEITVYDVHISLYFNLS